VEFFLDHGHIGFYLMFPLDCLLCDWLVCRACRSGQVNNYQLVVVWSWRLQPLIVLTLEKVAVQCIGKWNMLSWERRESLCEKKNYGFVLCSHIYDIDAGAKPSVYWLITEFEHTTVFAYWKPPEEPGRWICEFFLMRIQHT
jgi:hypothetical protein